MEHPEWSEESVASVQTREGEEAGCYNPVCDFTDHWFFTLTIPERREEPREEGEGAKRERGDSAEERIKGRRERGVDKGEKKIQIQSQAALFMLILSQTPHIVWGSHR